MVAWEHFWLSGTSPWIPPIPKAATDSATLSGNGVATLVRAAVGRLAPDAILTQTNLGGAVTAIDDDPDGPAITLSLIIEGLDTVDATSFLTASVTPAANTQHLLSVSTGNNTGAITAPTVTGCGLTWTVVGDQQSGNNRTTVFRASGASPTTGALTIAYGGVTQGNCAWRLVAFLNANTGAPVQTNTGTGSGLTTATLTLAAPVAARSIVFAAYNQATTSSPVTAGSGYDLIGDQTLTNPSSPSTRLTNEWSDDLGSDVVFGVGSGAAWSIVATEIAPAAYVDPDWMAGTGAIVLRVSFPTPVDTLFSPGAYQEFRIRVRPGT